MACTAAIGRCRKAHNTPRSSVDEGLAQLVDQEWDERNNRAIERSLRKARFRYKASVELVDYTPHRGLDPDLVHCLATCTFIRQSQNVLITGPTGTGKSFWTSALGSQACMLGFKVFYANTNRLLPQLKMTGADGGPSKSWPPGKAGPANPG